MNETTPEQIAGKWHLLDEAADEVNIPRHRADFVFYSDSGRFRGAMLNRITGEEEIPLARLDFDGSILKLQLGAPGGKSQDEMPVLEMRPAHGKFEGSWMKSDTEPMGPKLKLVKAKGF